VLSRLLIVLAACLTFACAGTVDATMDDAAVTADVVTALLNDSRIDGTQVSVQVRRGVVHLAGVQPTAAAAMQVVEIARAVQGVRDVTSTIAVGGADPTPDQHVR